MSSASATQPASDRFCRRIVWEDLDPAYLGSLIRLARSEDMNGAGLLHPPAAHGDPTTRILVPSSSEAAGEIRARETLTVCGLQLVPLILKAFGGKADFEPALRDGDRVQAGAVLGSFSGRATTLLRAERTLLNFLQHLSGIATATAAHAATLGSSGTRLLDTRKTTPGFRMLEKYAFACGGGWNHRLGLFDRILVKDNHLAARGATAGEALSAAVARVRRRSSLPVEVEVDQLDQIPPVVEAGADIIMLDNFTPHQLREAVALIGGRAVTEASGGITLDTLPLLGDLGLDFISTGAPVHQSRWIDLGLDWR
ncbi:MAG: carboxylating nicotinate-nucleotide diphosphorylase [Puniceicoccaceae bacterium]|nr:MAG: carboxylating nicotinate-nucleotide diphosphorylase [Puniceicoccaceae bacterium]